MGVENDLTNLPLQPLSQQASTFVEVLSGMALEKPNDTALVFLTNGEQEQPPLTYAQFHQLSMQFAKGVRTHCNKGDRVVLLFQSSLEFAVAFFGCLYAGVVSIPLPMPSRRSSDWVRMQAIIKDTDTQLVVSLDKAKQRMLQQAETNMPDTAFNLQAYEQLVDNQPMTPEVMQASDIAFLQYTSGSTGAPKGVMVSHNNLIENQKILKKGFRNHGPSVYLSWLPLFHDMGLIGNFMQAIYIGEPYIFMAPNAFLQKPIRWLKAMSKYKVRVSGAPNFAYDLCVDRISEEDKQTLDLSQWQVAFNGAEPVRFDTLKRFSAAFKSCGFSEASFYPCYGTAEATLIISGALEYGVPPYLAVDRASYEQDKIAVVDMKTNDSVHLVSSGKPLIEDSMAIVCGETQQRLPDLTVGQIWINSPCNASGYWNNPEASQQTFGNKIVDEPASYLNTGDLGFFDKGNVYITGRSKDLLIFNGRNIYPQDIEACSCDVDEALRAGRCAAVSLYLDGKERLILIHELERLQAKRTDYDEVFDKIRIAVYDEFMLPVYGIALVSPATIPMTSSGKIRRQSCRQLYRDNELSVVASFLEASKK